MFFKAAAALAALLLLAKPVTSHTIALTYSGWNCEPETIVNFQTFPDQICGTAGCTDWNTATCVNTVGARSIAFDIDPHVGPNMLMQIVGCNVCNSLTDWNCKWPDFCQDYPAHAGHCFQLDHPNGQFFPALIAEIVEFGCAIGDINPP